MSVSYPSYASRHAVPVHAVSVRVTPAIALGASSVASPTVLATLTPHGLVTGDTVAVLGHAGSTPAIDGARVVTVIDALHVSVPVVVTVAGAGGTLTRTIAVEPLTLAEGKLRAGLDWEDGDARDALMAGFITAARAKVEIDASVALLAQHRDVYLDAMPSTVFALPLLSRPLQAVVSLQATDLAGAVSTLDPATYTVDLVGARIGLVSGAAWPVGLRLLQPWVIRIVAGHPSVAALAAADPLLLQAVGLLTAHYATVGRDLTTVGTIATVPEGYADLLSSYIPVVVP